MMNGDVVVDNNLVYVRLEFNEIDVAVKMFGEMLVRSIILYFKNKVVFNIAVSCWYQTPTRVQLRDTRLILRSVVSNFKSVFLGEKSKIRVSTGPATRVGFFRKTIECKESRIGKQPIPVPSNVTIKLEGQDIQVKGPLGELSLTYPREVKVERQDEGILKVSKAVETRRANQMHGLFRTLTDNLVIGVSKGFEKKLQLIGVGYRATVEGNDVVLNLGFSHPVKMPIPNGIKVKVDENTKITVSGYDKSEIGQFAASIRKWRPPEPYKGKGIKYEDEVVRRKEGKAGKKK
ncbi:hypothetical protein TSUD_291250 [Trifolium subterraneum]|uniref:Large ribosomal subunit protein uL6c n=1 Tax=Trifolium subterraneum TaxID=3900 RepID=A0A2Z6P8U9_TRISU|nr:hypothetical protein TSUD_291250 [Trifolium subterraneum]